MIHVSDANVRHGFHSQTLVKASICQNNKVYRLASIALIRYSTRHKRFQTGALGVRTYDRLTNHICILHKWHVVAIQRIESQVRFVDNMLNN